MKKYFVPILWFIVLAAAMYFGYESFSVVYLKITSDISNLLLKTMICVFVSGLSISALVYDIICSSTAESLNSYKRELEKESIGKTETSSRVKVLESKIEVLEKALSEALNK